MRTGRRRSTLVFAVAAPLLVGASALGAASCKGCNNDSGETTPAAIAPPPVAAPDSLLCDIYFGTPNASWNKIQRGVGGPVGILPTSLPAAAVAAAGLDLQIASELDGASPIYGAAAARADRPAAVVFAIKVTELRRARAMLLEGDTARFTGRETSGFTELVPKGEGAGLVGAAGYALALSKNGYLVVASKSDDLGVLGAYVTRTLPSRPPPTGGALIVDVPHDALAKVVKPQVESGWRELRSFLENADRNTRKAHDGRAPDFGDPAAILGLVEGAIGKRVALLADLDKLRLAFDVTDDAARLTITMTPAAGSGPSGAWVDSMSVGDGKPVLSLPQTSAAALSLRANDEERASQVADVEQVIKTTFGERLAEPEAKRLHELAELASQARGDGPVAMAVLVGEPTGTIARMPVKDAQLATKAMRGGIDLVQVAPFKDVIGITGAASSSDDFPGFGKVSTSIFTRAVRATSANAGVRALDEIGRARANAQRDAGVVAAGLVQPPVPSKPDTVGLSWGLDDANMYVAAGPEPLVTFKNTVKAPRTLADEPAVARFVERVGPTQHLLAFVQPLRIDPRRANLPAAPVSIAVGKRGREGVIEIELSDALLREASRMQMGF